MENLYELIKTNIEKSKKEEKEYLTLFEEYFICHLVPTIMEEILNSIDLKNYTAFYNYGTLPVDKVVEIFKIDDGIIKYDKYNLKINYKLLAYFKKIISKFLEENKLGSFSSKEEYNSHQIIIKTNIENLIKTYKNITLKKDIIGFEDYDNNINFVTSSLDDIYENDIYGKFYYNFLESLLIIIKSEINKINILNYEDFDASKVLVDDYFYIILKNKGYHSLTTLDIVLTKNYEEAIKDLISKFLNFYQVGEMRYDEAYKIHLNCSLNDLMNAYYKEFQRIENLTKENNPKVFVKNN